MMTPHKKLFKLFLFLALLLCLSDGFSQVMVRTSLGMGRRNIFATYEDQSSAFSFVGEYCRLANGIGSGFAISYANLSYLNDSYPAIFLGSSNTVYIDQLLTEFMDIEKIPLGGTVSPYIGLLAGISLGAGFQNNIIYTNGYGEVSILSIFLTAGVAFYPVKNLGIHIEVGGPVTPFNAGLSFRFGEDLEYQRAFKLSRS